MINPALNSRPGATKLLQLAATLCRLVRASAPAIRAVYPSRPALLAVLTAAEALCDTLSAAQSEAALADQIPPEDFDPADSDVLPGQNP